MMMRAQNLARGPGWSVYDLRCTAGPRDRPFEEQHELVCIAAVTHGTFQYRSREGRALLVPGAVLLGNPGRFFECGHEHGSATAASRSTSGPTTGKLSSARCPARAQQRLPCRGCHRRRRSYRSSPWSRRRVGIAAAWNWKSWHYGSRAPSQRCWPGPTAPSVGQADATSAGFPMRSVGLRRRSMSRRTSRCL